MAAKRVVNGGLADAAANGDNSETDQRVQAEGHRSLMIGNRNGHDIAYIPRQYNTVEQVVRETGCGRTPLQSPEKKPLSQAAEI